MSWMAAFLTILTVFNLGAVYLWLCQRSLERSLNSGREVTMFPPVRTRRGDGAPFPKVFRAIGGRLVDGADGTSASSNFAPTAASKLVATTKDEIKTASVNTAPTTQKPTAPKSPAPKKPKTKAVASKATSSSVAKSKTSKTAKSKPAKKTTTAVPDDITLISGIGPVISGKLHAMGITTFAQIAAFTARDIADVNEKLSFKGRIEREEWVAQAKDLMAGKPPRTKG